MNSKLCQGRAGCLWLAICTMLMLWLKGVNAVAKRCSEVLCTTWLLPKRQNDEN